MCVTVIIFVGLCLASMLPTSVGSKRNKRTLSSISQWNPIIQHVPSIFLLCGSMGNTCKNSIDCCGKSVCGYASGYDYHSPRCCGSLGVTGCKTTGQWSGTGCCIHSYHCEWLDQKKGTTHCMPTLYKK